MLKTLFKDFDWKFFWACMIVCFFLGWAGGSISSLGDGWTQQRMFDRCLEWKKDFDLCRKEFMP